MHKNLARFRSIRFLLSAGFGSLAFILIGLIFGWILITFRSQLRQVFFARLQNAANLAAIQIDGDLHASLITVRQENTSDYQLIKSILQRILIQDPDFQAVRTLRIIQGRAFVVVDADKRPERMLHMLNSVPGLTPQDIQQISTITAGFVFETPISDPNGAVLAAFAPIYTSTGVFDGFMMISIPADTLVSQERQLMSMMLLGAVLAVGVILGVSLLVGGQLSSLLTFLAESAESRSRLPGDITGAVQTGVPARLLQGHPVMEISRLAAAIAPVSAEETKVEIQPPNKEQMLENQAKMMQANLADIHVASMVAASASARLDPVTMPELVVTLVVNQFDVDSAAFYESEPVGEWFVLKAFKGFSQIPLTARVSKGENLVGWVAENKTYRIETLSGGKGFALALPLINDQRTLGVLLIQTEKTDYFGEERCSIFQAMADQISVAYRNALLFAESKTALNDMQQSYQQLTQAAWEGFLGERVRFGYQANAFGVETIGRQQAVNLVDQERETPADSVIRIPVMVRGKPVGFLTARRSEDMPSWGQEDIELLEILTQQLSVALDNARLYSATQRSAERERVLSDITSQVRSSTSVDVIMQTAVRQLAQALNAPHAAIRMLGEQTSQVTEIPSEDRRP